MGVVVGSLGWNLFVGCLGLIVLLLQVACCDLLGFGFVCLAQRLILAVCGGFCCWVCLRDGLFVVLVDFV